jgi:Fic family protein
MRGFISSGGNYRTCQVSVGGQHMPHWREVPRLMEDWSHLVKQFERSKSDWEYAAFVLHVWLLCIHPWVDGNGRTARLAWNMLRVSKGLTWHIEPARTKRMYYAKMYAFEEQVFRKENPGVY